MARKRKGAPDDWSIEVRELRKRMMATQKELAARLHTNKLTISRWERGVSVPLVRHRRSILELSDEVK
jgi:DNA-binding transcriptional regulator YiaG